MGGRARSGYSVWAQPAPDLVRPIVCILVVRDSVIEDQQDSQPRGFPKGRMKPLLGVICVLLAALIATIEVTHVHKVGADTSHCPLCIVLHTAAPVAPTAAIVVVVPIGRPAQLFKSRAIIRFWRPKFFTRPPPAGC